MLKNPNTKRLSLILYEVPINHDCGNHKAYNLNGQYFNCKEYTQSKHSKCHYRPKGMWADYHNKREKDKKECEIHSWTEFK